MLLPRTRMLIPGLLLAMLGGKTLLGAMSPLAAQASEPPRIATLSGSITEVVYALGAGGQVVARDATSIYPPEVTDIPSVGHVSAMGAEGILRLRPQLVLAPAGELPHSLLQQLRATGVRIEEVDTDASPEGVLRRVEQVAEVLGRGEAGGEVAHRFQEDLLRLRREVESGESGPAALVLYLRGPQSAFACGPESVPGGLLALAGGRNAALGIRDCQPMTSESVAASGAEALVVYEGGLAAVGGVDGLLALPGVAITPAGRAPRIVVLDQNYLGTFGPRSGQAALEFRTALLAGPGIHRVTGK